MYWMHFLHFLRTHLLSLPVLAKTGVFLGIMVGVPRLSRRLKLPDAVGLLLAGIVIGPYGFGFIGQNRPIADFFAELGKLLLMFGAGLEVDLALFRKTKKRAITFGLLTTSLPLLLGATVAALFRYPFIAAVVIGSLLASHTLLGLPILVRLGETHLEPITVTVGATVMSDTLSLIVFAICISTFQTGFSVVTLGVQLLEIVIFVPFILFGVSRLGAWLLKRVEDDESAYFVVMIAVLITAGYIADRINLPEIVGAFLAGLAVNAAVQSKPAKKKLEFFGNSIFIPIFFIVTGFLINPVTFLETIIGNLGLVVAIIVALLVGKGIAAETAGRAFGYTRAARSTMWSLTLPQVAATLAATLVAYNTFNRAGQRLLDVKMLNVVLVLMLFTAILGPVLTERFAPELLAEVPPTG
jgi:Kef-type K+ transport system membrane component KefB